MYLNYWKLERMPFENRPDPKFFYYSPKHEEALARLEYVITQKKQLALLTGEYGSGKTMLAHTVRGKLPPAHYQFVYAGNPFFPPEELLQYLLQLLSAAGGGIDRIPERKTEALQSFTEILRRNRQIDKHTVIIFDEAHLIADIRVFEEIRVLLNYTFDNDYELTLVLMGQTEVREKIAQLPQFRQRVNFHYHLQALSEQETGEYLAHRLKVAGHPDGRVFAPDAVQAVAQHAHGLSRTINTLADMALMLGMDRGAAMVDAGIVANAAEEVLL